MTDVTQQAMDALKTALDALDDSPAIANLRAQFAVLEVAEATDHQEIAALKVAVDKLIAAGTVEPPPPPPPPVPTAGDTVTVSDQTSQKITGNGNTTVLWRWTGGGGAPFSADITGPFLNPDGSVYFREVHGTGQRLDMVGCHAIRCGINDPDFTERLTSGAISEPAPPSGGGGGAPSQPQVIDTDPTAGETAMMNAPPPPTPAPTGTLGVTPAALPFGGGNVTLNWTSFNAVVATINGGVGAVSTAGSVTVNVSAGTTFTITLTGLSGTTQISASVFVASDQPTPTAGDFFTVADQLNQRIVGNGNTVVLWRWTGAGGAPFPADVHGPYLNLDGSVFFFEDHTAGQRLDLVNCYSIRIGINDPDYTEVLTAGAINQPPGGGGSGGGGGGGGGGTGTPWPALPTPVVASTISSVGMAAVWHLADSSTVIMNQADGTDLGNYSNPFTGGQHKNIRVYGPNSLTTVFRPEIGNPRLEAEFAWGNIVTPMPVPGGQSEENDHNNRVYLDLGPISIDIYNNGALVATATSPNQFWNSTWFWETAPRPVVRTAADLVAANWVLPMNGANDVAVGRPSNAPAYSTMRLSDINSAMPDTGISPDIGMHTQRNAYYIATGDATIIPSILAWGYVSYTLPTNVTDPWTGAPISLVDYPGLNFYEPPVFGNSSPRPVGYFQIIGSLNLTFQPADHEPALAFIPFALTGDIKFLLAAQRTLAISIAHSPEPYLNLTPTSTRGYAWSLRDLFNMERAMRDMTNTPTCLLPYSYWKMVLDHNRDNFTNTWVNNPDPFRAVLRVATNMGVNPGGDAFFMADYLCQILGQGVWQGNEDWRPAFEWKFGHNAARSNGTSGWPNSHPAGYWVNLYLPDAGSPDGLDHTQPATSWTQLAQFNGYNQFSNGTVTVTSGFGNRNYLANHRACLKIGALLGTAGAAALLAVAGPQIVALNQPGDGIDWQQAF